MDLCTKKIIDYTFSKTIDAEVAIKAVSNAIKSQKPNKPVILHSDFGSHLSKCEVKRSRS